MILTQGLASKAPLAGVVPGCFADTRTDPAWAPIFARAIGPDWEPPQSFP